MITHAPGHNLQAISDTTNIKRADEFISVREEIKEIKDSISKEKETVHIIKGAVKSIEEKLDETVSGLSNTTAKISCTSNESSVHGMEQSRNIVKLGIQRHVLQIQQLIGMKLQSENPDLKLNATTWTFLRCRKLSLVAERHWKNT